MDIENKIYHMTIHTANIINYCEYGKDVEIDFEILDGPLAGCCLRSVLDNTAKALYLKGAER